MYNSRECTKFWKFLISNGFTPKKIQPFPSETLIFKKLLFVIFQLLLYAKSKQIQGHFFYPPPKINNMILFFYSSFFCCGWMWRTSHIHYITRKLGNVKWDRGIYLPKIGNFCPTLFFFQSENSTFSHVFPPLPTIFAFFLNKSSYRKI